MNNDQKLQLCMQMFDIDGDGKISLNDLLKYALSLNETDRYLKNDVMKLIKLFENKSAIDSTTKEKKIPYLTTNYKSSLFGFTEGYTMQKYSPRNDGEGKTNQMFSDLKEHLKVQNTPTGRMSKHYVFNL